MEENNQINIIATIAIAQIVDARRALQKRLQTEANTDIGAFMRRVLDWHTMPRDNSDEFAFSGQSALWEMFNRVIEFDALNFMDSFNSFVANELIDDGAFVVEWRKTFHDENNDLVWDHNSYGYKTVLCDKSDPRAEPIVLRNNDGTQNVALLMEAMDHKVWEHEQRVEQYKKLKELYRKWEEMKNNN